MLQSLDKKPRPQSGAELMKAYARQHFKNPAPCAATVLGSLPSEPALRGHNGHSHGMPMPTPRICHERWKKRGYRIADDSYAQIPDWYITFLRSLYKLPSLWLF
ncbi:MAG: hypothetical protein AB8B38_06650 [Prochlorococcus sp.]